jgi:hypothetical protein
MDWEPLNDADDVREAVRAGYIEADDVYCEHGTFVGTAYGPDYLCHWCESGVSMAQLRAEHRAAAAAGELCKLAKHGGYLPDSSGTYRPLHWVVYCVPVGPCPHWAGTFGDEPAAPDAWLRMGMTTNDAPPDED